MMLLIGADSEIGAATLRHMNRAGETVFGTTRRSDRASDGLIALDLSRPLDDWAPPAGTQAACIFAAIPRLAACAADPAGSAHINVTQTLALVDRLVAAGSHAVFLSTNQVFDGSFPHMPADAPRAPVSEYGCQKARTEAALERLMATGAPVSILRLSKIVSPDMPLVHGWTRALRSGEAIRAFTDMTMAPVETALVVQAIAALMNARARGIFQLTGPADVTYADVARHIARQVGADATLVEPVPAASAGMPDGATPRHTTLDSSALNRNFGITAPGPWEVVDRVVQSAKSSN
jgi:dTDP-4-dehydrorhamnose reductase